MPDRIEPASPGSSRHRARGERRSAGGVPRLPWRRVVNPFTPLEILSADQVEAIHRAALAILRDTGVEVLGEDALGRFERAGAAVSREAGAREAAGRVRLDPAQVEALVALAPPRFELRARNPERGLVFGDRHLVFGVGRRAGVRLRPRPRPAAGHACGPRAATCG